MAMTDRKEWLSQYIWQPFAGVDVRSLALMRVMLAIATLVNITLYWPDAGTFFADGTGFFPRSEAIRTQSPHTWSLLYISASPWFMHAFFALYTLSALAFLFGYKTRAATVLCWVFAVSLKTRGLLFTNPADMQLVIVLFWSMFLPLGARFSVDSALNRQLSHSSQYASTASLGLVVTIACIYFMGALDAWDNYRHIVYYALSSVEHTTPLAPSVLMLGGALGGLGMYFYCLQLMSGPLMFVPGYTQHGRLIVALQLILMQLFFGLVLSLGIYPLVGLAGLCALLPALFWDPLLRWWNARPHRRGIAIFYDRDCGFCLKCCLIFKALGLPPETAILPAQDDEDAAPILARENSWVVQTHARELLTHWNAVAYVWRRSPLLFPLGFLFMLPGFTQLGRGIYNLIARHRPALGTWSARALAWNDAPPTRPSLPVRILLGALVLLVLAANLNNFAGNRNTWPRWADTLSRLLALNQRWFLQAPYPQQPYSAWIVAQGTLEKGDVVDAMHRSLTPPSHDRPHDGWALLADARWRKYVSRLNWEANGSRVTDYYCHAWRARYPDLPLKQIEIFRYEQGTPRPGKPPMPSAGKSIFTRDCPQPKDRT